MEPIRWVLLPQNWGQLGGTEQIMVHGLFLKKINGWFHIDFPSRAINLGEEKEYLDTCRPATAEWRRAITEVVVAEWSKLFGARREEAANEQPNV